MTNKILTFEYKGQHYKLWDVILVNVDGVSVTRYLATDESDNVHTVDPSEIYVINP